MTYVGFRSQGAVGTTPQGSQTGSGSLVDSSHEGIHLERRSESSSHNAQAVDGCRLVQGDDYY